MEATTDLRTFSLIPLDKDQLYSCLLGKHSSPLMDSTPFHMVDIAIIPAKLEFSPVSAKYLVNNTLHKHVSTPIIFVHEGISLKQDNNLHM